MSVESALKKMADERVRLQARVAELASKRRQAKTAGEARSLREQEDKVTLTLAKNALKIRTLVDSNLGDSGWTYDQRLLKKRRKRR